MTQNSDSNGGIPPMPDGPMPDYVWYMIHETLLGKFHEFDIRDMKADLAAAESGAADPFEQAYNRAKWMKYIDLRFGVHEAMKKYETEEGKLLLVAQKYGDQMGLPSSQIPSDVVQRMEWLRRRIAGDFERDIRGMIDRHGVT